MGGERGAGIVAQVALTRLVDFSLRAVALIGGVGLHREAGRDDAQHGRALGADRHRAVRVDQRRVGIALGLAVALQLEEIAALDLAHIVDRAAFFQVTRQLGQRDAGFLGDETFEVLFLDRNGEDVGFLFPQPLARLHRDGAVLDRVGGGGADGEQRDAGGDQKLLHLTSPQTLGEARLAALSRVI